MLTLVHTADDQSYGRISPSGTIFVPAIKLPTPIAVVTERPSASDPKLGELACGDIPIAVGYMLVAVYTSILLAFGIVFSRAGDVIFMVAVCGFYLAVYLGVPALFFRLERSHRTVRNRSWVEFLETGLSTSTGRISGISALAQIFTIPVALTAAVCGIGLMLMLAQV